MTAGGGALAPSALRTRGGDRGEEGRRIAREVARRTSEIAPHPIRRWPRCQGLVEEPTSSFRAALTRWEDTGSFDALQGLRAAVVALLRAFTEAARQWREAGRPGRAEGRERVW